MSENILVRVREKRDENTESRIQNLESGGWELRYSARGRARARATGGRLLSGLVPGEKLEILDEGEMFDVAGRKREIFFHRGCCDEGIRYL